MSSIAEKQWTDAQVGVIGSLLIEPELAPQVVADTAPSDYTGECRSVYNAVVALMQEQQPIDIITIRNRLGESSGSFLRECMKATPTAANIEAYISICKEQSRLRAIQQYAMTAFNAATLDEARAAIAKMNACTVEDTRRISTVQEIVSDFITRHDGSRPKEFLDWGFSAVNDELYIPSGKYVVIGGYPSDGKSALMLQMAKNQSKKMRVGIFSFETDSDTIGDRLMSHASGVSLGAIIRDDLRLKTWQQLNAAGAGIHKNTLEIIEASGMTAADITAMTISRNYQLVYIDYLQLIEPDSTREIRSEQVARISRQLQQLAKRRKVTVVALSQLNRPEPSKSGYVPAPTLRSLRESGQIEQDADAVMLLYREDSTDPQSDRILMIAKNKEGRANHGIRLQFKGETQTFSRSTRAEINRLSGKAKREAAGQTKFSELEDAHDVPFELPQ